MHNTLDEIKKIQGICHNDFDSIIISYINSCKQDLKEIGIKESKVEDSKDDLIHTAILTYTLSFLDVPNCQMYQNSYLMQKDVLRHLTSYTGEDRE